MSSKATAFPLKSQPEPIFNQVLSFLTSHKMSLLRRVDRKYNSTIMRLFNKGFQVFGDEFHNVL